MKKWIDLVRTLTESIEDVTSDETKFWYSAKENRFIDHDIDTHHVKMVAQNPEDLGIDPTKVAHHPHASGEYTTEYEFDDDDFDVEEFADNNDMGLFHQAFSQGWVRGGHFIDIMTYHDMGDVKHDGGLYLQSPNIRHLRKAVSACLVRWPDIDYFIIDADQGKHFTIQGPEDIRLFVKFGKIPS